MENNWFVQPTMLIVVDEWGDWGPIGFHSGLGVFGPYTKTEADAVAKELWRLSEKCKRKPFSEIDVFQIATETPADIWNKISGRGYAAFSDPEEFSTKDSDYFLENETEHEVENSPIPEEKVRKPNRWARGYKRQQRRRPPIRVVANIRVGAPDGRRQ